jgi:hypothetical protein
MSYDTNQMQTTACIPVVLPENVDDDFSRYISDSEFEPENDEHQQSEEREPILLTEEVVPPPPPLLSNTALTLSNRQSQTREASPLILTQIPPTASLLSAPTPNIGHSVRRQRSPERREMRTVLSNDNFAIDAVETALNAVAKANQAFMQAYAEVARTGKAFRLAEENAMRANAGVRTAEENLKIALTNAQKPSNPLFAGGLMDLAPQRQYTKPAINHSVCHLCKFGNACNRRDTCLAMHPGQKCLHGARVADGERHLCPFLMRGMVKDYPATSGVWSDI